MHRFPIRLSDEISKIRENAATMLETSRLEEASLRRLLETAAAEGRRLVRVLEEAEAARDEALAASKGVGGEANELRQLLATEREGKKKNQRATEAEITSKVRKRKSQEVLGSIVVYVGWGFGVLRRHILQVLFPSSFQRRVLSSVWASPSKVSYTSMRETALLRLERFPELSAGLSTLV